MTATAVELAERASFETFVNCYVRELATGTWHARQHWKRRADRSWPGRGGVVLELALHEQSATLAFDVPYRSLTGRHHILAARLRRDRSEWQDVPPLTVLLLLVRELSLARRDAGTEVARAQELELVGRLTQSLQLTARYVAARRDDLSLSGDRFIDSEQSMLYGHWSHPTPKSRQGMTDWQHDSYAPELRGVFQLRYFAARRSIVAQCSARPTSAEELVLDIVKSAGTPASWLARNLGADEVLIPAHPLQVDWLLHQPHVRELLASGKVRELGPIGPHFTATSSVRTVYNAASAWMLKLSIPVRITNSLRFNQGHETLAGVAMAVLLDELDVGRRAGFDVIADPACLTVAVPGRRESGFEVILRENPFMAGHDTGVHCLASIVQEPLPHRASRLRALIEGLALMEGRSAGKVCREWFAAYWDCAIDPAIRLYDEHGIALEAHQQNSLLDVSAGYPLRYFYRDNQGYYLSAAQQPALARLAPQLEHVPGLFHDDALIRERLSYYLIANQLFSVVHRFGRDGLIGEESLLAMARQRLQDLRQTLSGRGREFVCELLERPRLAYKANLLTRLHDVDELTVELERALYTTIDNPLSRRGDTASEAREVA